MTHTNAPHSSLALLPFLLAAAVSATFSGVFFWTLGTTPFESALFVSVALALELAKGVFLRRAGAGRGQRVFRVGMIGLLILFSITASVALGVSRLEGAIEQQALADRETRQIDTMLEQLNEQEAALRENLSELPIEWRITKNEYVDQLEQIRSDQSALMGRRAMLSRSADSSRMNVGAVWITTADVLRSEPDTLLMGFLVAVAVALELVIVGSGTIVGKSATGYHEQTTTQSTSEELEAKQSTDSMLKRYAKTVLVDQESEKPKSIRQAAQELDLSVAQVRPLHEQLKQLGVLRTEGRATLQILPKKAALQLVA